MSNKKHRGLPVHNMADEPNVSLADVLVDDIATAKAAGEALMAEVEREYDVLDGGDEYEGTGRPAAMHTAQMEVLGEAEDPEELKGEAQDERVIAMEELKDMAESVAAPQPRECPTCHRPFSATTLGKDGGETKSSKIRKLAAQGMSKGDIGRTLGISYQFVHNVLARPTKVV